MTIGLHPAMAEALRLTRAGNLADATALIQATLAGGPRAGPSGAVEQGAVIDLEPDRVTISPQHRTPPKTREPQAVGSSSAPAGRFEERCYSSPTGTLRYRLYVPVDATLEMPLVVMLHGCTQSPEDFASGTRMNRLADEFGFLVAYPAQSHAANAQKCWNWFRPGDQQRDRGEPALIAGITREVIAEEGADPSRVYVAGLSAGGAEAAIVGAAYPELYAAVGIHSGLACGAARDLPSALMAMRNGGGAVRKGERFVPVITFHGDRDTMVHEVNSQQIIAAASLAAKPPLRTRTEKGRSVGGCAYTREVSIDDREEVLIEQWTVHGAGHAWSGGDRSGSYTNPNGPDASREMVRFFLRHRLIGVTPRDQLN